MILARENTWSSAISNWERTHGPSERIWERSLATFGYRHPHPKDQRQVAEPPLGQENELWTANNHEWLALRKKQTGELLLLCRNCSALPAQWHTAGRSWTAFQSLLESLEALPTLPSARPSERERPDPWEIRY